MNVMAYDPYKPACDFPEGVEVVRDLDRIYRGVRLRFPFIAPTLR